jgi:Cu(I)/Ag(I) efflux system membrane fusion protein
VDAFARCCADTIGCVAMAGHHDEIRHTEQSGTQTMNESPDPKTVHAPEVQTSHDSAADSARAAKASRRETMRWWLKLTVQPALFLAAGALLLGGLALAQRLGWISTSAGGGHPPASSETSSDARYVCPMMCTPPQTEPGRCPVCNMELVAVAPSSGGSNQRSITIDPVARRVANIRTVAVKSMPLTRQIRAIGELTYNEGALKTLSAYVDGRLERLYADYTGVVVNQGDQLALVYSPQLYSGQAEFLLAKEARDQGQNLSLERVLQSRQDLYENSRQRLIEMGMTEGQVADLEQAGKSSSRMHLCAPISGTVIEKLAVEGQYVKEGQPIYRLADLSTVWLMLELFPEDAAAIRYGHKVEAEVQSLPGRKFTGRVAFIDPIVNPKTRTVGVRAVIPNPEGLLRIGDYAKARIDAPVTSDGQPADGVYDADLADKWISPRHPHVVESAPGKCRICGVDLVPAANFGFTSDADTTREVLVVPRNAVLMAGGNSVVYVESEPGRFEIRGVTLGPRSGDQIAILSGVKEDERVATAGNFLIDSQMQLAGNPSLIDPTKYERDRADGPGISHPATELSQMDLPETVAPEMTDPSEDSEEAEQIAQVLAQLPPADRARAEQQKMCPVADMPLGSMGPPIKVEVNGRSVFICCEGCRESLLAEPAKYLAKLSGEVTQ